MYSGTTPISAQALGQLVSRILIGALFVLAGLFHLRDQSFFYPELTYIDGYPEAALPFAYIFEFIAALALVVGWQTRLAAWMLIFYTFMLTVLLHGIAGFGDAQFLVRLSHVGKNAGVVGGLIYLAVFGGGPISLDHRLRRKP